MDSLKSIKKVKNVAPFAGESYFPMEGVSLKFLLEKFDFSRFSDMFELDKYIFELTKGFQCSFLELLSVKHPGAVAKKASHFVCFAYSYETKNVFSALEEYMKSYGAPDLDVWISVFSINPHYAESLPPQWFDKTFAKAIPSIGHTLFVFTDWYISIALGRLWCIFELWVTVQANCKMDIVLGKTDEEEFVEDLLIDVDERMRDVGNVQCKYATTSRPKYKGPIVSYLANAGGFSKVDNELTQRLRFWFAEAVSQQIDEARKNKQMESKDFVVLLVTAGRLLHEQGDGKLAEKHVREALTLRAKDFGKEGVKYAKVLEKIADAVRNNERVEDMYSEALSVRIKSDGEPDYFKELGKIFEFLRKIVSEEGAGAKKNKVEILSNNLSVLNNENRNHWYEFMLKKMSFETVPVLLQVFGKKCGYSFLQAVNDLKIGTANDKTRMRKIQKDLNIISKHLPTNWGSSIFVRADQDRPDVLVALITGPEGTPYENGVFLFDIFLPAAYPSKPPQVKFITTGGGSVRFNPNLYADGKVCLSLLGTWHGPGWKPKDSTLLQVLVSIQGLVLVNDPYFNEPGYENSRNTPTGKKRSDEYSRKIRSYTMRWAVLDQLEKPHVLFKDVIRTHFLLKRKELLQQSQTWSGNSTTSGVKSKIEKQLQSLVTGFMLPGSL